MKTIRELLRDADPLRYEAVPTQSDRDLCRAALLEAALGAGSERGARSPRA